MKKLILISLILVIGLRSFSQKPFILNDRKVHLLEISKKKKTKASAFLAAGTVALAAGIPMFTQSSSLDVALGGISLMMIGGDV